MTAQFYERFVVRVSCPLIRTPLSYSYQAVVILDIPREQKDFFDRVFLKEGDIFEGFIFDWEPVKELILKEIFEGVQKLESFAILNVLNQVVSKVACTEYGDQARVARQSHR